MFTSNKFRLLLLSTVVLLFCYNNSQGQAGKGMGEPVIGAEVFVEQEPNEQPSSLTKGRSELSKGIRCISNQKGEFSFSLPIDQFKNLPELFTVKITIIPPKNSSYILSDNASNVVIVNVRKTPDRKFQFILLWIKEDPQEKANKGVFAVSGRNTS